MQTEMVYGRKTVFSKAKLKKIRINTDLYLWALIPVIWLIVFRYWPMYGNIIAFKRFIPNEGILGSPWVGLYNFSRFFTSPRFKVILFNTLSLSFYQLLVSFPIPIVLAIMVHHCIMPKFKKGVQLITYAPHFISSVVIVGIIFKLLAARIGIVSLLLKSIGLEAPNFLGSPAWFRHVYVWSNVWQQMGWGSIIYLAALSSINLELYEAAKIDGANIWRRIRHIDLPGIAPTITILLILSMGRILELGFEKVLLLQNNLNISASEIIQTYVYKIGLAGQIPNPSYAAAIGLFQNGISFILLLIVNRAAKKMSETSLW